MSMPITLQIEPLSAFGVKVPPVGGQSREQQLQRAGAALTTLDIFGRFAPTKDFRVGVRREHLQAPR
jgi:hypothetical protein